LQLRGGLNISLSQKVNGRNKERRERAQYVTKYRSIRRG
jgi:hypothetical protein